MNPRVLFLPMAAIIICGLVVYRLNRQDSATQSGHQLQSQPCPDFEHYDAGSESVRLSRYLGRHSIIIVFYDGEKGADTNPKIQQLYQYRDRLKSNGVVVIGISRALPQVNEKAWYRLSEQQEKSGLPLFLLLSDLEGKTHESWRVEEQAEVSGDSPVFIVDRAGRIPFRAGVPVPVVDFELELSQLIGGL